MYTYTQDEVDVLRRTLRRYEERKRKQNERDPDSIRMMVPLPLMFADAVDQKARSEGITRGQALREYVMAGIASEAANGRAAIAV
jgi:hypothetical protein